MAILKKEVLKDHQTKLEYAIKNDETGMMWRMEQEKMPTSQIDMMQIYEKMDIENKFTTWKISSHITIFVDLK